MTAPEKTQGGRWHKRLYLWLKEDRFVALDPLIFVLIAIAILAAVLGDFRCSVSIRQTDATRADAAEGGKQ